MLVNGGMHICPAEIAGVMVEHSESMEVAIIGAPDERRGESVKAVVILIPDEEVSKEEIIE